LEGGALQNAAVIVTVKHVP